MFDPTKEGFYVVLRQRGQYPNSDVDEIVSDPIKGLKFAENEATVNDSELTAEQIAAGIKHYCLPHPVAGRRIRATRRR